ncbi:MAG TPA: flavodoxin domain-containing protein [Solimonas sp.]|nr:flavodoxin domain-containing protein [Solimonas sp.]
MTEGLASAEGQRVLYAAAVVCAWLLLCVFIAWSRREQRRSLMLPQPAGSGAILVCHASQTGYAQRLALQTAQALQTAGMPVQLQALGEVGVAALQGASRVLFVASTTGEGDPPDTSIPFVRKVMRPDADLQGLRYGLLALGDREYRHFCGFGHTLDRWLRQQGARPLFDLVEVDNADGGALRHWQHHLGLLSGSTDLPDWSAPSYGRWRLAQRRLLNPGSAGGAAFHLGLEPLDGLPAWEAGDIAEIGPRNGMAAVQELLRQLQLDGAALVELERQQQPLAEALAGLRLPQDSAALQGLQPQALVEQLQALPHREYSIASLPAEGCVELLVRRMRHPDGHPGLGSGWLTEIAAEGGEIALRIRENPGFRPPAGDRPLILIGNGTGLAGLRAHLKARIAAGRRRNWLLFGERSAACDYFHRAEIEAWQAEGWLQRVDLAFSRDQAQRVYVQERLRAAADELRRWVEEGAAVYVCGSLQGMAPAVDAVLREVLGSERVEQMLEEGGYRRDVY